MTADRRVAANRANAKKSTGPRSQAGKQRSSRNAKRHGLAIPVSQDMAYQQKAVDLAKVLVAELELDRSAAWIAYQLADAEVELARVRAVKAELMVRLLELPKSLTAAAVSPGAEREMLPSEQLSILLRHLAALDRYEQRAISRRKRAMRQLTAIQKQNQE